MWIPILIGAFVGYLFGKGVGAVLGGWLGWWIARELRALGGRGPQHQPIQAQFTESTFAVMGAICKADGRVDEREIAVAEAFMRRLRLSEKQRGDAILAFNRGKAKGFDLDAELARLKASARNSVQLRRMFIEVQLQAVLADGQVTEGEHQMLLRIASGLGLSAFEVRRLDAALRFARKGGAGFGPGGPGHSGGRAPEPDRLAAAYDVLGVDAKVSDAELKKVYRKLMAEHHPDRLAANGLPESMRDVAEQKTRDITAAYDLIKDARGR